LSINRGFINTRYTVNEIKNAFIFCYF
jgi:hypothetical protein